ncbi:hypothetical protein GCM10011613_12800 [Cellvibrio zantedeschiae]|uniref:Uncharacterized protein n=1 Tax=Cellvibrio zantedeschiae TaxID=1237077 RepID=A0ABQ3AZ48_9GAMM|nr:hypothetical protein [Cellvibrio zantedeschiae]GGY69875.1 hypothetical protein GCM10011613_12800 [Cellvibrio zantedeschiae]
MLKAIFSKTLISVVVMALLTGVPAALASDSARQHKHNLVSRETSKTKTDSGFIHTLNKTDDKGATAMRRTEVSNNKADRSRTRTVSGSTFEGKTYSGQSVSRKTDTGYTSQEHLSNSDGKVVDRSVNATIDKEANTVTKEISVTEQGEETKTRTRVHPLKRAK